MNTFDMQNKILAYWTEDFQHAKQEELNNMSNKEILEFYEDNILDNEDDEVAARYYWDKLRDVPVDEDGYIEEDFMELFNKGTDREDIWHWIEDTYNYPIYKLQGLGK